MVIKIIRRRKLKKGLRFTVVFLVLIVTVLAIGSSCTSTPEIPRADLPVLNNDLAGGKYTVKSQIQGEAFSFIREYSTSYNSAAWRITDSKSLLMRAWLEGAEGATVLVEHVHIDIAIKSRYEQFDGWPQDSMDDSVHGGIQPGFLVTNQYPYENVFAIEGFSQTLIDGWAFFVGSYGYGGVSEDRLTEETLVDHGKVYGNKVQVVYDLLIKYGNEPYFHTRSIIDEFLVPTATQPIV